MWFTHLTFFSLVEELQCRNFKGVCQPNGRLLFQIELEYLESMETLLIYGLRI